MFFSDEHPKDYIKYEYYNNGYEMSKWETILKVGYDKVEEIVKSWDETCKQNVEIQKYNNKLFSEAMKVVDQFFKECGIDKFRYSSVNPFKKLGSSKEWNMIYEKLIKKYKVRYSISKPNINQIKWNNKEITYFSSGDSLEVLKRAKNYYENHLKNEQKIANRFQNILRVAKENNIDLSECTSENDMYNVVDEFMKDQWIEKNYSDGTEVYLKHECDECSVWFVGDRRCSCGNRRITLTVEGNFIDGFYAYPEAY